MPSRAPAHSAPASTTSRGPSRPSSAPSMTATTPCRSISSSSSTTTSGAPRCTSRAVLLARRTWVRPSSSSWGVPQGVQVEEPQEQVCHCCKAAGGRWKSLSESIMVYQLCKGVAFCHGRGVRHHDLEPHNLQIGGWVGIIWFDPSKRKYSLLFINQRHFLLSWMDGTPSI
ncbi:hypothetical protein VPH35_128589 [Triticum aestivum]